MILKNEIGYYQSLGLYERSQLIVQELFQEKKDKSGHPYMNHLIKVSEDFEEERIKSMALMHDVLEDTKLTSKDLKTLGYDEDFIKVLELLTNTYDTYEEYIDTLLKSNNHIAIQIKMKDVLHNMDISRFASPKEKDFQRVKRKYIPTYMKILDKLEGERTKW